MLLSKRLLTKQNDCLTVDTIKWVLKNALNISPNTLYQVKVAQNADHPLMREESLYDDLPVEVQALFVMEPYFPRKHFDRAFAWLFGKESIAQINADDFSCYEQRAKKNICYTLSNAWKDLQLSSKEYLHLFNEFDKAWGANCSSELSTSMFGLMQNANLTLEIYKRELSSGASIPNYNVCAEVANRHIDKCMENIRIQRKITAFDVIDIEKSLRLENISRYRRDALLAELDMKDVGFSMVSTVYNNNIPDDVFKSLIENGTFNEHEATTRPNLLSDVRFPKEDATRVAFSKPQECANYYLARSDLDNEVRAEFISALTRDNVSKSQLKEVFSDLFYDKVITRAEFDLAKSSLGSIYTPYCISKFYDDVESFVSAVECSYKNKDHSNKDEIESLRVSEFSSILYSPYWTKEALLQLLDITREWPADLNKLQSQKVFRQNILRKLFCESVYLSLDKENLTGPYGRAENLLARLLDSDAHLLSEFDVKLIARSRIQLDYSDAEVNLATSLANNPDINDRIVAERLRLQLEQISDTPSLAPARQRRAL